MTQSLSLFRTLLKAALALLLLGLISIFMSQEQTASLYNRVVPGRERLPYGEDASSYNLSLNHIPAAFASHEISRPKRPDEIRIIVLGDSGTWGWFLENDATLSGQLNAHFEGDIEVYNLAYPILSITKDTLILDEAIQHHEPDLIIWPITLESLAPSQQTVHPIVQNNPDRVGALGLPADLDPFAQPTIWDRSIVGRRQELANRLRLQLYGIAWAATGIDQTIPEEIALRKNDFDDLNVTGWHGRDGTTPLISDDLAFEVIEIGVTRAGDIPVLLINEPIYVADGQNSDIRYNSLYPRWAYDQYRDLLTEEASANDWLLIDLWNEIEPDQFTDSPVHLTPAGTQRFAYALTESIESILQEEIK